MLDEIVSNMCPKMKKKTYREKRSKRMNKK